MLACWAPITKTGGMAHIPSGSSADLGPLREELKNKRFRRTGSSSPFWAAPTTH